MSSTYIVSFVLLTFTEPHRLAFNELVQYIFLLRANQVPSKVNGPYVRYVNCECNRIIYTLYINLVPGPCATHKYRSSLNFRAFYTKAQSLSVLNHNFFSKSHVPISPLSAHTRSTESTAFSTAWMPMCSPI